MHSNFSNCITKAPSHISSNIISSKSGRRKWCDKKIVSIVKNGSLDCGIATRGVVSMRVEVFVQKVNNKHIWLFDNFKVFFFVNNYP